MSEKVKEEAQKPRMKMPAKEAFPKFAEFDVKMSMRDDSMNVVVTYKGRTKVYPVSPQGADDLSELLKKGATFMKGK